MLKKLTVRNFKSLMDVSVEFPSLAVLFGPNAAGKSNLLDAIAALSRIGNVRTLSDVLDRPLPVRGHAFEAFSFPAGGLPALLKQLTARFSLEADLAVDAELYRYRVEPSIELRSGRLSVADEYLALLGKNGNPKGTPAIERVESSLRVRRKGKPAHPRQEPLGKNHAILSDRSLAGDEYRWLEAVRDELGDWCTHYLDPGLAMRAPAPPGRRLRHRSAGREHRTLPVQAASRGARSASRLHPAHYARSCPTSSRWRSIWMNAAARLTIVIRQDGVDSSSRIVSEGGPFACSPSAAIAVNPWGGSLLAFEEPENGVHPRAARSDRPPADLVGVGRRASGHRDDPLAAVLRRRVEAFNLHALEKSASSTFAASFRPRPSNHST